MVVAPDEDVIEFDEICVRKSPVLLGLWLWIAISRQVGQVLGFAFGERTGAMLRLAWSDVPESYQTKLVKTDHWEAYAQFFPSDQHEACNKGSGQTSHVEAWNTKWRQWQSGLAGLVRRSCGVSRRIADDLYERYLILVEQHNDLCRKKWLARLS